MNFADLIRKKKQQMQMVKQDGQNVAFTPGQGPGTGSFVARNPMAKTGLNIVARPRLAKAVPSSQPNPSPLTQKLFAMKKIGNRSVFTR